MYEAVAIQEKAAALGKLVVRMTARAGSGHASSALSLAHLITYLMYRQMRYDPANPWHPNADRLVLSEGHAVPIVYAAYADLGGAVGRSPDEARRLTTEELDSLRTRDSVLDGHPNPAEGFPFFDAATGSLGQGLSVAAGLALASRLDGIDRRIYVLIGDGESREGQNWEALDFIADYRLRNVCAVFNCNGQGQASYVSPQQSANRLADKLEAFGWKSIAINGHDPEAIEAAFSRVGHSIRPLAVVAQTIKGWGVDALQQGNWHGKPLRESDLDAAERSLDRATAAVVQRVPPPSGPARPLRPATEAPRRPEPTAARWPAFGEALAAAGLEAAVKSGKVSTRRAYGAALRTAGDLLPQIAVLDGDVSNSTFSEMFARAHPERFFECRIAEQNMVSVAVGLSAAGYIPFVNSFAKFLMRACDQVEMASVSRANIKLVGSHSGISLAADGPSQMGLTDVAFYHAFARVPVEPGGDPLCRFYHPADAVAAYHCTRLLVEHRGLGYMRTHRPDVPLIYDPQTEFEAGGFHVLREGKGLALISAGYMVHVARQAAELLHKSGRSVALIDAYSLPLSEAPLLEALRRAGGRALVVEDNYGGGLGAAVAELAARTGEVRVETMCCQRIPKSTRTAEEILDYCGVGVSQIVARAHDLA